MSLLNAKIVLRRAINRLLFVKARADRKAKKLAQLKLALLKLPLLKLSQLRDIGNPAADKVANAIHDALYRRLDAAEQDWVNRIEKTRKSLSVSTETLEIVDYGAGKPNSTLNQEEMYRGTRKEITVANACHASMLKSWAILLFKLVRQFQPKSCIELGTCVGISAAYQASAQLINGAGSTTTLEGAPALAALSQNNLKQLGLHNVAVVAGRFQDTLDQVLKDKQPVDYAFIDGHHDEAATIAYFNQFLPVLAKQAVLVFDDIAWSDGMRRAWEKIAENDRVKIAVDFGRIGVCVLDDGIPRARHILQIPLFADK